MLEAILNLSLIELQIITTAVTIITHAFNIPTEIKKLLRYKDEDFVKPWDCVFCWSFWMGALLALINWKLLFTNTVISYIYDKTYFK